MPHIFWKLTSPETTRGLAEWDDSMKLGGPVFCPTNPGHRRAGKRLTDLSVLLTSKKTPDFVWTWQSECLIQERVLQLFREQGFTGFEVKPVRARMKVRAKEIDPCDDNPGLTEAEVSKARTPTLWEVVITGWAGMAPPESGIRLIESCPDCGLKGYSCFTDPSRLIDESQWDGSDFFMVWPLPRFIFVTDRVARFINDNKLRGVGLKHLTELKCEGILRGGRLSYRMPEARARELGEPLGIY
jgi:hypothetical protein